MSRFGHLTPRYIRNRVAFALYQRRNPEKPWLTPDANRLLETMLRPNDVGLEWGSGRSTIWLAQHLKRLTSVEDNQEWHRTVQQRLGDRSVRNVDYRYVAKPNAVPPEADNAYVRVADEFEPGSLTFALVDGEFRGQCANAAAPKLARGGLLVLDNANWFIDFPTNSPASRHGKGSADPVWDRFLVHVKDWRLIWTSSGVTDTAIWIRPE